MLYVLGAVAVGLVDVATPCEALVVAGRLGRPISRAATGLAEPEMVARWLLVLG